MGNDNIPNVFGKGIVELQFTYGNKLVPLNMFHVLEIRKNLISTNLLYKKGLKVVLEYDKVVISKNGVFVGKGCFCGGIFKLSINNNKNVSAYIVELSITISRLGHVNFNYLDYMSRHGLISCSK